MEDIENLDVAIENESTYMSSVDYPALNSASSGLVTLSSTIVDVITRLKATVDIYTWEGISRDAYMNILADIINELGNIGEDTTELSSELTRTINDMLEADESLTLAQKLGSKSNVIKPYTT